ncbi:unnamed protein product, partial [Prorocentrum cordatum]
AKLWTYGKADWPPRSVVGTVIEAAKEILDERWRGLKMRAAVEEMVEKNPILVNELIATKNGQAAPRENLTCFGEGRTMTDARWSGSLRHKKEDAICAYGEPLATAAMMRT